ncbi:hypothetical protein C8Q78DRAFT_995256 [Trametes maxima]|nr:hypothetical protein C8Q78DRAFT_995256 [Trametes maxima]
MNSDSEPAARRDGLPMRTQRVGEPAAEHQAYRGDWKRKGGALAGGENGRKIPAVGVLAPRVNASTRRAPIVVRSATTTDVTLSVHDGIKPESFVLLDRGAAPATLPP